MAQKASYQIEIDAKTQKAVKGIKDVADESQAAAKKVDLIADALAEAADKGASDLADVRKEAQNTEEIFQKLSTAVGDTGDSVSKADLRNLAAQLTKAGVEAKDLDERVDDVAASIRKMGQTKQDAEQLTRELEDAQRAAKELDSTDVDIDIKTDKVKNVGDDLDRATEAAGRAQTGIGTLRGVTDELGGSAGQIGTYGAAFVDAGETIEIFGSKLGLSETAAAKLSAGLGTFAVAATAALAVGAAAWSAYNAKQEETKRKTKEATEAMQEQLGVLDKLKEAAGVGAEEFEDFGDAFTAAVVDAMDEGDLDRTAKALSRLGLTVDKLGPALVDIERNGEAALSALARQAGVPAELADNLAKAVDNGEDWNDIRQALISDGWSNETIAQYKSVGLALEELNDQQQNYDADTIASNILALAAVDKTTAGLVAKAEAAALAEDADASASQILDEFIALQNEQKASLEELNREWANNKGQVDFAADSAAAAAKTQRDLANAEREQRLAVEETTGAWSALKDELSDESAFLSLQDSFDNTEQAAVDAWTAAAEGADDAEQKIRNADKATIDLKNKVIDYGKEVLGLPPEVISKLIADIDQGKAAEVQQFLTDLTKDRTVYIKPISVGGNRGVYADGTGPSGAPEDGSYLVGERGPEVVNLRKGDTVHTATETRAALGRTSTGPTTVQHIYGFTVTPREVRRLQKLAERRGFN